MIKFIRLCPKCGKEIERYQIERYQIESIYNHYPCSAHEVKLNDNIPPFVKNRPSY